MQARRRPAAALAAALALVGLTACQKPTPIVTLYSGGATLHDNAFSYCFPGQDPAQQPGGADSCRFDTGGDRAPALLRVKPGGSVLVDVDKDLADTGWFVALRGRDSQASRLPTQTGHTVTFSPDFSQSPTITVQVTKLSSADNGRPVGVWQFVIAPA